MLTMIPLFKYTCYSCCCSVVSDSLTPWTTACQASVSFTIFQSLLKFMSIESMMPSNHLPLSPPPPPALSLSQHQVLFQWVSLLSTSGGQSTGASASVLPVNIQGWFPLGLTGLVSLFSKRLSRVFSRTTIQRHQFFGAQPSLWSLTSVHNYWKSHRFDYADLCWQSGASALV